ncbi:fumarylacetoacetate hydrolase family protein [Paraburkholderia sp. J12]|uniref:fumarylacetoacetate hydrolase family protein n=1 Tax=Paraburkholderia sp. J12 TaxID=2805432 RepID=UPI002ABE7C1E|nr:fumarylacetoacetate hydrolase family protein [Paraburkholderia sp. J12]
MELLALGENGLDVARAAGEAARGNAIVRREDVLLHAPTTRAGKMFCLGLNYVEHADESEVARPDFPVIFLRTATSLVGPDAAIIRPNCSDSLDFEGELVAIVGKRARHVSPENALDVIAGYSVFNDASIRDYQFKSSQWTLGKNFDGTGAFGPVFVTADELPPGAAGLKIETRLNGTTVQSANTSDMIVSVVEAVVLLSKVTTLEPGDLLIMGTPGGVGLARKPQLWMKPGDICEVEIERIGCLSNPIQQEAGVEAIAGA